MKAKIVPVESDAKPISGWIRAIELSITLRLKQTYDNSITRKFGGLFWLHRRMAWVHASSAPLQLHFMARVNVLIIPCFELYAPTH